jgi:simple sugar transport system permease protein
MIPILFAASAGLFPALAGSLNIALEGLLLIGAFTSLAVFYFTGSLPLAIIAAAAAGAALSAVHVFASYKLKANNIIAGLAVNLFSAGLCAVLSNKIFNTRGVVSASYKTGSGLVFGFLLFSVLLLAVIWVVINKTSFGFRLRACDKNQEALESLGIKPQVYQIVSILFSGILCGIGGSFLSLNLGSFVPGMSAGKGWIALVIIFLGSRKPQGILLAAFAFGLAEAFSNHAQGMWEIPADLILAFPYFCTLIAMIIVSIARGKLKSGLIRHQ